MPKARSKPYLPPIPTPQQPKTPLFAATLTARSYPTKKIEAVLTFDEPPTKNQMTTAVRVGTKTILRKWLWPSDPSYDWRSCSMRLILAPITLRPMTRTAHKVSHYWKNTLYSCRPNRTHDNKVRLALMDTFLRSTRKLTSEFCKENPKLKAKLTQGRKKYQMRVALRCHDRYRPYSD
jgi:hypothetical protein